MSSKRKLPVLDVTFRANDMPLMTPMAVPQKNTSFRTMHGPELSFIDHTASDLVAARHRSIQKASPKIVNETK